MIFFVMGLPKPQSRPRAFVRGKHAAVYSPVTEWRNDVKYAAAQQVPFKDNALRISIEYLFSRPKSHYGTGKNSEVLKASAPKFMTKRPDLDNLNKAILDALQDSGLIGDDSSVIELASYKLYINKSETQGAEIQVYSIT